MEMKHLSSLLDQMKDRFRVEYPDTLFPPEWGNLKDNRCILCGCKLYQMNQINHGPWICKSVKHKKAFAIKDETLNRIKTELQ